MGDTVRINDVPLIYSADLKKGPQIHVKEVGFRLPSSGMNYTDLTRNVRAILHQYHIQEMDATVEMRTVHGVSLVVVYWHWDGNVKRDAIPQKRSKDDQVADELLAEKG